MLFSRLAVFAAFVASSTVEKESKKQVKKDCVKFIFMVLIHLFKALINGAITDIFYYQSHLSTDDLTRFVI